MRLARTARALTAIVLTAAMAGHRPGRLPRPRTLLRRLGLARRRLRQPDLGRGQLRRRQRPRPRPRQGARRSSSSTSPATRSRSPRKPAATRSAPLDARRRTRRNRDRQLRHRVGRQHLRRQPKPRPGLRLRLRRRIRSAATGRWSNSANSSAGYSVDSGGARLGRNSASTGTIEYTPAGVPTGKTSRAWRLSSPLELGGWFYYAGRLGEGFGGATIASSIPSARTANRRPGEAKIDDGFDIDLTTDDVYINNIKYVVVLNTRPANDRTVRRKRGIRRRIPGAEKSAGLAVDPASGKVYVADVNSDSAAGSRSSPRTRRCRPRSPSGVVKQIRSSNAVIGATINPGRRVDRILDRIRPHRPIRVDRASPLPIVPIAGRKGRAGHDQPRRPDAGDRIPLPGGRQKLDHDHRGTRPDPDHLRADPGRRRMPEPAGPQTDRGLGPRRLPRLRARQRAADTGGYNVSSDLVAGQSPLPGFPAATGPSKLLYTLELGLDSRAPASRPRSPTTPTSRPAAKTAGRRNTSASPPTAPDSTSPFASAFTAADDRLETFAFAGTDLCSPCFADGKTGIPVRRADGSIVQGMAGSSDPGPGAQADILVRKRALRRRQPPDLRLDRTVRAPARRRRGQPAIYSRDLDTGTTALVSKDEDGANIPCLSDCATEGVAELDLSADGSRVVVGQLVGHGPSGADLWHPYVNIDGASSSIDLAPDIDRRRPLLRDHRRRQQGLLQQRPAAHPRRPRRLGRRLQGRHQRGRRDPDPDHAGLGRQRRHRFLRPGRRRRPRTLELLGSSANCDVVPVAGGGGLGRADGSFYFLSPEQLDGSAGVADAPNLYLAKPDGDLAFVATLESDLNLAEELTYQRRQMRRIGGFTEPGQLTVDKNGEIPLRRRSGDATRSPDSTKPGTRLRSPSPPPTSAATS